MRRRAAAWRLLTNMAVGSPGQAAGSAPPPPAGLLYMTHAALPHLARAAADSAPGVADLVAISSTAGRVARAAAASISLNLLRKPQYTMISHITVNLYVWKIEQI
jgi:hypothetical protein